MPLLASGQDCNIHVLGFVKDANSSQPISYANIYLREAVQGSVSDSTGHFSFQSVCAGQYHLTISHIGCEPMELFVDLQRDTSLVIVLHHNSHLLDEITITGEIEEHTNQEVQSVTDKRITEHQHKNLAGILETITGVNMVKNGQGIAKPVVHGLYGNRLTILNHGIPQSGQQWGADHSPEIDPMVANKISVIKGVSALEFQGSSLGSVILVEPKGIQREPHLHGRARYFFESNGLGNGLNLQLQQYDEKLAWRIVGTLKKRGDGKTSKYFLRNTGMEESNLALQLEKQLAENWNCDLYFSSFNTRLGVLRGSHIGNLSDLEAAFDRKVPFFTNDHFSYLIEAPYQQVNHHLMKVHSKYSLHDEHWVDLTYASQWDYRKEYDVRRGGRSESPALSLKQLSHFLESKYKWYTSSWRTQAGVQFRFIDNANIPETGILPLIPNYVSYQGGLFALASKEFEKVAVELGGRYDYEDQRVAAISFGVPREIIHYKNRFQNLSLSGGIRYHPTPDLKLVYNLGLATRNPAVNELYSHGLHQGVSGIEEGDPSLTKERSIKHTLSVRSDIKKKLSYESILYFQHIKDYIYLEPQEETRLTIRGAFPVFKYEQTTAQIFGLDLSTIYQAADHINMVLKYSYIKGRDRVYDLPLIGLPSNDLSLGIHYQIPKWGIFENLEFRLDNRFVLKQTDLLPSQDFADAPDSYHLFGLGASAEKQGTRTRLNLFCRVENLFNVAYRDYLNRQRYFADDLGINLIAGVGVSF